MYHRFTLTTTLFNLASIAYSIQDPSSAFDYVIVGAGPAGLVLANRLSADPSTQVAVIEAGDSVLNNPNVSSVLAFGTTLGSEIDWTYQSAPQKYTDGKVLTYDAGKALGGTTTINGMTYIRAEKEQIDQWESLGNDGWNWDGLFPYYLKHERFQRPGEELVGKGASFEERDHGFEGNVAVGWSQYLTGQGFFDVVREASEKLGIAWNRDVNGGRMRGFGAWPLTLNVTGPVRWDAARAYYYPVSESRPNLHVFVNTTATKVIWDEASLGYSQSPLAKGVEVIQNNGTKIIRVKVDGEVILSAGSIRSPALLEHSGVGNPAVLEPLGIKTVVELPGVGANLQDQPNVAMVYASSTNWTGYPSFVVYLPASDLFGDDLPAITESVKGNISEYAKTIVADSTQGDTSVEIQETLLKMQADLIFSPDSTVPLAELLWFPNGNGIAGVYWNLLPFARGTIHIASPDPTIPPRIQSNIFQQPIDMLIQAAASVALRSYFSTSPLSNQVTSELDPNSTNVPLNATYTDPAWETWIKAVYGSNNHPLGTCAMMSKELGGVVDSSGRVYGTKNIRVVDASIMPMQVSGHLSASVYAVAEKIAEGIVVGKEKRSV